MCMIKTEQGHRTRGKKIHKGKTEQNNTGKADRTEQIKLTKMNRNNPLKYTDKTTNTHRWHREEERTRDRCTQSDNHTEGKSGQLPSAAAKVIASIKSRILSLSTLGLRLHGHHSTWKRTCMLFGFLWRISVHPAAFLKAVPVHMHPLKRSKALHCACIRDNWTQIYRKLHFVPNSPLKRQCNKTKKGAAEN